MEQRICDYEGSNYRTDFWEGQGRTYEDGAERIAIRAMLPPEVRRIIDIGAGFGRLASLYDGYDQVVLLDYSQSQLEYARERLGDERFTYVAADIYRLPLVDGCVDAAVMVRVLHHLEDVPTALRHLARIVAPGGTLVLEHANKRHLKNIFRHALGRGPNPHSLEPMEFSELHFDFHPRWVRDQLAAVGLAVEKRRAVSTFRIGALKSTIPTPWLVTLDGCLQRPLAGLGIAPSMFYQCSRTGTGDAPLPDHEALFRCPACDTGPLTLRSDGAHCARCDHAWPRINGVYVFK